MPSTQPDPYCDRGSNPAPGPANPRRLGRSRAYTAANLPPRLQHWHAPRVNRWERLCVAAGTLAIERLGATGTAREVFASGESRWFAPGIRWRVAEIAPETRFELEVHADSLGQADAPQGLRSELLDEAERRTPADAAALAALISGLAPGERRLIRGGFDPRKPIAAALGDGTLFWHPLASGADGFAALIARGEKPFDLREYLGRDHAVIEAALGGALRGERESTDWLHATLERHLHIEEDLIFPAWLEAGGREAWVRGLENEHRYLRQYLCKLAEADGRRKFLRLLDGHDEKEERVVYPDVLARLGRRAIDLLPAAASFPVPSRPATEDGRSSSA